MEHGMILSASGWRKIFASSGNENDAAEEIGNQNRLLVALAAASFAEYIIEKTGHENPVVLCGHDSRPTSEQISDTVILALIAKKIIVRNLSVAAAPEIMATARKFDGFIYVTASHNPIGHNGIKFGLNDGGVLEAAENKKIIEIFENKCNGIDEAEIEKTYRSLTFAAKSDIDLVLASASNSKQKALDEYRNFVKKTVAGATNPDGTADTENNEKIFEIIKEAIVAKKIGIVCDFNGSARAASIDKDFFAENGIAFQAINDEAGKIFHGIIPEGKNLEFCADEMRRLHKEGKTEFVLGYMPDCDGDRGNIVYWDDRKNDAVVMAAQEVFSLSVLSELLWTEWLRKFFCAYSDKSKKIAVCVNCPTSMRIEKIAHLFGAEVFRAEVGEANVVNLARQKRSEGYDVRILGEGSNGGTITHPACVRDPLNTILAFIKLLSIEEMYKSWCKKCGIEAKKEFSLGDIFETLPLFATTPTSEERAVVHLKTKNQAELKKRFQQIFEAEWQSQKSPARKFGFDRYEIVLTNGTKEIRNVKQMADSGTGGLKIVFYGKNGDNKEEAQAFMWMRGSQTEPIFRMMCDVAGDSSETEKALVDWERQMLARADV